MVKNPLLITPAKPLPSTIGIIGAGTIGPDIGYYLKSAIPGLKLILVDIDPVALDKARERIHRYVEKGLSRGKISAAEASDVQDRLHMTIEYAELADCDWVIEAATEDLELKRQIFTDVEAVLGEQALITSNTSSIPAAALFSHLKFPERATVTHFFAPAFRNPAVEVIDWEKSAPWVIDYLRWLFCITGKVPMLTRDVVCFMLDRIFDNWCNEAGLLLDAASPAQIDYVASEFVHAGPFFVLNLANGNPIIIETNTRQMEYEGTHYQPASVFAQNEKWETISPGSHVEVQAQTANLIKERLLGVLFSQTYDILDRNIGAVEDLDLGCRLAFAFKQGPLELATELGATEVQRIVQSFIEDRPGMPTPSKSIDAYNDFYRHVLVDVIDDTVVITLRRPEALNALHDEMTDEILSVFGEYAQHAQIQGFVLTGFGTQAFCAGADIGRFVDMLGDHSACVEYARACSRLLRYLDECELPVVAALNGMALGGGLELAMRCDQIIATNNVWMQLPEITLGIVPGIGGMVIPYRRWPQAAPTFNDMLLRANKLSAVAAQELGIVAKISDSHADLLGDAIAIVKRHRKEGPRNMDSPVDITPEPQLDNERSERQSRPLSAEVAKILRNAVVAAATQNSLDAALETGYQAFAASAATAAAREGIDAFLTGREPNFSETG